MAANDKSFLASLRELTTAENYIEGLEPKEELRQEISRISESGYYAGWNIGIEFYLWQAILGGSRAFGIRTLTKAEIAYLKTLSGQSNGWWYWSDSSAKAVFVPMDEWQKIYESFSSK